MKQWKKDILKSWWNENLDYLPLGAKWRGLWQKRQVQRIIRELNDRKIDIEVAEKIFGRKVEILEFTNYDGHDDCQYPQLAFKVQQDENPELVKEGADPFWYEEVQLPKYSTDIKDAYSILKCNNVTLDSFAINYPHQYSEHILVELKFNDEIIFGEGKTEEEAICLAALEYIRFHG